MIGGIWELANGIWKLFCGIQINNKGHCEFCCLNSIDVRVHSEDMVTLVNREGSRFLVGREELGGFAN